MKYKKKIPLLNRMLRHGPILIPITISIYMQTPQSRAKYFGNSGLQSDSKIFSVRCNSVGRGNERVVLGSSVCHGDSIWSRKFRAPPLCLCLCPTAIIRLKLEVVSCTCFWNSYLLSHIPARYETVIFRNSTYVIIQELCLKLVLYAVWQSKLV